MTTGRVLIIDRDPSDGSRIGAALGRRFVTAIETNRSGGLSRVGGGEAWDLVLLDDRMLESRLVLEIRERDPQATVLLMTASGDMTRLLNALHEGAAGFIRSPFTSQRIQSAVRMIHPRARRGPR